MNNELLEESIEVLEEGVAPTYGFNLGTGSPTIGLTFTQKLVKLPSGRKIVYPEGGVSPNDLAVKARTPFFLFPVTQMKSTIVARAKYLLNRIEDKYMSSKKQEMPKDISLKLWKAILKQAYVQSVQPAMTQMASSKDKKEHIDRLKKLKSWIDDQLKRDKLPLLTSLSYQAQFYGPKKK